MFSHFFNHVFPTDCVGCSKPWSYLCSDCRRDLVLHSEICPVCHSYSKYFFTCPNCRKSADIYYEWIIIWFKYTGILKKLILNLKFLHLYDQAEFLWQIIQNHILANPFLQTAIKNKKLVVSFVPSHWFRKYFIKGYNQSELLAKKVAQTLKVPFVQLCQKTKYTKSQTKLNRKQRLKNLLWVFSPLHSTLRWDETILVIDDITTTWSTINEVAKTLKSKYPDVKIRGVVLGRHA